MCVRWTRPLMIIVTTVVLAVSSAACDDVKDPFELDPTPITYSETFSGTLTTGSSVSHPFAVSVSGTVTLTLTSVAPDVSQSLGFDIGTWDGTTCNPIFGTGSRVATQGYEFAGSAIAANFCARVHDGESKIPSDTSVTYGITVKHP